MRRRIVWRVRKGTYEPLLEPLLARSKPKRESLMLNGTWCETASAPKGSALGRAMASPTAQPHRPLSGVLPGVCVEAETAKMGSKSGAFRHLLA